MSVWSTSPVSSYSSLIRQHLAQPSHRDSHSPLVIWARDLRRQNGSDSSGAGELACFVFLEFGTNPRRNVVGRRLHAEMAEIFAVRPHEVDDRAVVHGIVRPLAHFGIVDAIGLG